ncbi:hypothetical protein Tco_0222933 [Tanacetum coccineum]
MRAASQVDWPKDLAAATVAAADCACVHVWLKCKKGQGGLLSHEQQLCSLVQPMTGYNLDEAVAPRRMPHWWLT